MSGRFPRGGRCSGHEARFFHVRRNTYIYIYIHTYIYIYIFNKKGGRNYFRLGMPFLTQSSTRVLMAQMAPIRITFPAYPQKRRFEPVGNRQITTFSRAGTGVGVPVSVKRTPKGTQPFRAPKKSHSQTPLLGRVRWEESRRASLQGVTPSRETENHCVCFGAPLSCWFERHGMRNGSTPGKKTTKSALQVASFKGIAQKPVHSTNTLGCSKFGAPPF